MEKRSSFRIAEWDYRVPSVINKGKTEFYVDIPNLEGKYQVSNLHNVRSWINNKGNRRKKPKILKQRLNKYGYPIVCLHNNGMQKTESVHRLMWLTWRGEIPEGYQVNHINEIKTDNRIENLNLMTCKENNNWGTRNERIAKNRCKPIIQKSLEGKVIAIWSSAKEIQRKLGYSQGNITACCKSGFYLKGKWINKHQAYNYLWQYEEDNTN
jgi:hypothetical protein